MTTEERDLNTPDPDQGNDAVNSGKTGAPISLDDATVNALIKHPTFQEVLSQRQQAVKDRRIAKLDNQVNDILERLNLSPEQTAQVKEIQRDQLLADLQARVLGNEEPSGAGPAKPKTTEEVDIIGSFTKAGFDPNYISREDLEFAENFNGSSTQLANALLKRRIERQSGGAPVSAGGVMPASGGVPVAQSGSQSALEAEYRSKLSKIRPGSVDEIMRLKMEYRNKGLNIY